MKRILNLSACMATGFALFAMPGLVWGHGGGGGGFHAGGGYGGYHGGADAYHGGYHGGDYGGYHGYGGYGYGGYRGYGGYGGYGYGLGGYGIGGYSGYGIDRAAPIGPAMSRGYEGAPRTIQNPFVGGAEARGAEGMGRAGEAARPGDLPRQDYSRPSAGDVGKFMNMPTNRGAGTVDHPTANHGLSPEQRQSMNNRWNEANKNRPLNNNPADRDWGNNVRNNFQDRYHDYQHWFGPGWWANHPNAYNGWYNRFGNRYAWGYWWGVPAWGAMAGWLGADWGDPVSYDYGTNVVYQDDSVNMNGQPIATPNEYNQSAYDIAAQGTPPAPATQDAANPAPATDGANWMPLGVFALSTSKEDQSPSRVLQLALNKDGSIGGTYYNQAADSVLPVQGSVDKLTQRACFTLGDDKQTVIETGIYNLTKDDAPVLIHFGTTSHENGELVRLKQPDDVPKTGSLPSSNSQR